MSLIAPYQRLQVSKQTVNVRRFNKYERLRRLRLATYVALPRLVKLQHKPN